MIRKFEMPWRPAYEAYAAAGWVIALVMLLGVAIFSPLPAAPLAYMLVIAVAFTFVNINSAWNIWSIKFALCGWGIEFINYAKLLLKIKQYPKKVWLGYGFDWKPEHTQRIYELKKMDPANFYPPDLFLKAREKLTGKKIGSINKDNPGAPWIHGVEPNEVDLLMPFDNLIGNTLIVGTTRCGKTRKLDVLLSQFVTLPNGAVICVDPKGDEELEANLKRSTIQSGRGEKDFMRFHLAFPSSSIRIDAMKNYNNPSELATRLSSLMSSESAMDPFQAFAWDVTNAIVLGLIEAGDKPSILKIRQYVEGGVEPLMLKVLVNFINRKASVFPQIKDWEIEKRKFINRCIKRKEGEPLPDREPYVQEAIKGLQLMYETMFKPLDGKVPDIRSEAVDALSNIYKHDVTHYGKMIANYKPILSMLTTGELAGLLSPDVANINDERLVTDMMSIINSKSVIYIGLNALADKTIASAVGALLLSDLAACAAARYNFKVGDPDQKIFLVVDEAAQVVNDPYIQILNMAGGSGFANVAATQTIPDFKARLGSEDKARQMLGNFNNLFALRSKDRETQDFITETFGESYVYSLQTTQGTNSSTEKNVTHFGGTISERMNETLEAKFPTELLGMLPNWQYIASISGGRLIKGRVPIITG